MYIVRIPFSLREEIFPFTITWTNLKVTVSVKYTSNKRIYAVWLHLYGVLAIVKFTQRKWRGGCQCLARKANREGVPSFTFAR